MCQPQPGPAIISPTIGERPPYQAPMTGCGDGVGWR